MNIQLTLALRYLAGRKLRTTLTTLAIVSLVVAGVIIVVYLIVANVKGSKMQAEEAPALVACIESDASPRNCWPMAGPVPAAAVPQIEPQS